MAAIIIKRVVALRSYVALGTLPLARPPPPASAGFVRSDKVPDCFHQLVEVDWLRQDALHAVEIDGWYRWITTTGTFARSGSPFFRRKTSHPSITGIQRSSRTREM